MRAIIVTGATGGLGNALVNALVGEENTELFCLYRNKDKFEKQYSEKLSDVNGYLISEDDDFSGLCETISLERFEDIVLVLNAFAITPIKRIGDFSSTEIERFIYGNLTRNVLLLNVIVSFCKSKSRKLRIINIDSGAADFPLTGWGNYCSAKAYINSFMSVIAAENKEFEVVSFDPGVMNTNMQLEIRTTDKMVFDQVDAFIDYKNKNILRDPSDVARQIKERYISNWTAISLREKIQ